MYLSIGGRKRPFLEARASVSYEITYDGLNRASTVKETWGIDGRIIQQISATEVGMTAKILALEADLSLPRPDIVLLNDDGVTPSALQLLASQCISGPDLLDFSLPNRSPDIYPIGVQYGATFQATRLAAGAASNPITEFMETLTPGGGGMIVGLVGGAINDPEYQIFKQNSAWYYTQSGSAVGLFDYPPIPGPIWPGAVLEVMQPVDESPRVAGPIPMYFKRSWEYKFGSPYRLFGRPHVF